MRETNINIAFVQERKSHNIIITFILNMFLQIFVHNLISNPRLNLNLIFSHKPNVTF